MEYHERTNDELIEELKQTRRKLAELEKPEMRQRRKERGFEETKQGLSSNRSNQCSRDYDLEEEDFSNLLDISKPKLTEDSPKISEEKYRVLVERALEGIAVAQDGVLRFVNRGASNIIGYDSEDLVS